MTTLFKTTKLVTIAALLTLAASQQASAATVSFGGQDATDGSGRTSSRIDASNQITDISQGYFVETFDAATAIPGFPAGNITYNVAGASSGCAINSPLAINFGPGTVSAADEKKVLGVRNDSVQDVAAAPANDSTCYAYTSPLVDGVESWIEIDYSQFLADIGLADANLAGSSIDYLGFYWGSVDLYNSFEFYSGDTLVKTVTGPELLAELGGKAGDQVADSSNVYVNIDFTFAESFDSFRVLTSGVAGEFDNIAVGLSQRPVPAPGSLAFLGLGLLGLGLGRRFKK
ncbi:MAG: hypothetical protein ACJA13_001190 [Paraglaciecola sp.]|jgi:hypothetical protein